jgi:uncharacterized protein (TIGR03435 family)
MDGNGGNVRESDFTNTSMHDLALLLMLNGYVERPVVDRTGIQGAYDFKLRWTRDETKTATASDAPPGLFTAMQDQLGLKLEPVRAQADVLMIDRIERPGAN